LLAQGQRQCGKNKALQTYPLPGEIMRLSSISNAPSRKDLSFTTAATAFWQYYKYYAGLIPLDREPV
jgi:hypothetical protein